MSASRTRTDGSTVSPAPITYGQLGILLELLWRGEKTAFLKCDFCQTLNHRFATRCEACSGKLSAASVETRELVQDVSTQTAQPKRRTMQRQRREWAKLMLWVLGMPMLLFAAFLGWQQSLGDPMRLSLASPAVVSSPTPSSTPLHEPLPELSATGTGGAHMPAAFAAAPGSSAAAALSMPLRPLAVPQPLAAAQVQATAAGAVPSRDGLSLPLAAEAEAHSAAPARASPHARLAAVSPRAQPDPTAVCEGRMFLLRAICVNRRCAEPQNAQRGRCVEVVRQRHIDEARRNPTLVGWAEKRSRALAAADPAPGGPGAPGSPAAREAA